MEKNIANTFICVTKFIFLAKPMWTKGGCILVSITHSPSHDIPKCFHPSQNAYHPLHFLLVGTIWMWEDSLQHPLLSCTPSFSAHWSSSLSVSCSYKHANKLFPILSYPLNSDYDITKIIVTTPHKCMSSQKLFCLSSHYYNSNVWFSLVFSCLSLVIELLT